MIFASNPSPLSESSETKLIVITFVELTILAGFSDPQYLDY